MIAAEDVKSESKAHRVRPSLTFIKLVPNDPRKTKQLHCLLKLAVGEGTEISLNTRTDDGMTNSAGNVVKLYYKYIRQTNHLA